MQCANEKRSVAHTEKDADEKELVVVVDEGVTGCGGGPQETAEGEIDAWTDAGNEEVRGELEGEVADLEDRYCGVKLGGGKVEVGFYAVDFGYAGRG